MIINLANTEAASLNSLTQLKKKYPIHQNDDESYFLNIADDEIDELISKLYDVVDEHLVASNEYMPDEFGRVIEKLMDRINISTF